MTSLNSSCRNDGASKAAGAGFDGELAAALKGELNAMEFDASAKERMEQNINRSVAAQQVREGVATPHRARARKSRAPFRFAAAVAAVVALFGMGTFAYASGALVSVSDAVAGIFGAGPAPTEVVDKVGHPIGAAQSCNGVTVSADAVIADRQNYAIIYSISKDDGTAFEGLEANEYGYLNVLNEGQSTDIAGLYSPFDGGGQGAYGGSYFYDADPADNAIQMVEQMSVQSGDRTLMGRTVHAQFGNFRVTGDSYEDAPVMAAGDWNLSFVIECEDASVEVAAAGALGTPSGEAIVTELTLSPIAVTVEYAYGEGEVDPDAVGDEVTEAHVAGDVTILMDDGSTVVVKNNGGMAMQWEDDGSLTCRQSLFLPQVVDVAHVSSITVGGTEFPVQ